MANKEAGKRCIGCGDQMVYSDKITAGKIPAGAYCQSASFSLGKMGIVNGNFWTCPKCHCMSSIPRTFTFRGR